MRPAMNLTPFSVEVQSVDDGVRTVSITGELDQATADQLRAPLQETIEAGTGPVMIDMSGCSFIDSTGLGVIVEAWKALQARNGDSAALAICCPEAEVRRLLEVTGLDQAIEVHDTRDDALAVLKQ
jgi:anti-sigma B factor antagonist